MTMTVIFDDIATIEITEGLTEAEMNEIDELRILIEQLGMFLENGPEGYNPPPVA